MHAENYTRTQLVRCIEQYNKNSTMRFTNGTIGSNGTIGRRKTFRAFDYRW